MRDSSWSRQTLLHAARAVRQASAATDGGALRTGDLRPMLERVRLAAARRLSHLTRLSRERGTAAAPGADDDGVAADALRGSVDELAAVSRQLAAAVASLTGEVRGLRGLSADLAAQRDAIEDLQRRQRRDLGYALDRLATATTAEFVARHLATARAFDDPAATLRWALSQAPPDGLALEFGVGSGTTLRIITPTRPRGTVFGFDSFAGLPETWRTDFEAGTFALDEPPEVPRAELVVGAFEETLPGWAAGHTDPVVFLHLDADLYTSTATVLEHLGDRLVEGSIVVFDEYFNYPGWPEHEHRAWTEFVERTGTAFTYEGYTRDNEQVVIRVTKPGG
jgi:SAM-dependent methyltransferase